MPEERVTFVEEERIREAVDAVATAVWSGISAQDYEAHMGAVGQSAALRAAFKRVYADVRPRHLAVLGCTTGSDLMLVDPAVTERAVGVDANAGYLELARARLASSGRPAELVAANVLDVDLGAATFDLVHAALLLEYVEPRRLFERVLGWLAPHGTCSIITQEPSPHVDVPTVSPSPYPSLQRLAGVMTLRSADEIASLAERAGLRSAGRESVSLPNGKQLTCARFSKRIP
jgi:hypothetical protein